MPLYLQSAAGVMGSLLGSIRARLPGARPQPPGGKTEGIVAPTGSLTIRHIRGDEED